jgi:hypothetical protein
MGACFRRDDEGDRTGRGQQRHSGSRSRPATARLKQGAPWTTQEIWMFEICSEDEALQPNDVTIGSSFSAGNIGRQHSKSTGVRC